MEESPNREPEAKLVKTGSENDFLSDLIVLGLPYKATESDLKEYFQQYGELAMYEIKHDPVSKESRGFGFIRYKNAASAQKALKTTHTILGRRCEVRLPKKKDEMPLKLFIGRLPDDTSTDELRHYFSEFGELTDVYIPKPFRGFGFVTFAQSEVAREVLHNKSHTMQGNRLNVTYAEPKGEMKSSSRSSRQSSRSQDRPFDFEDMRQLMYNNTRQMSNAFNPYASSNKSPRHTHNAGAASGDVRSMFYAYADQAQQQQASLGGAYSTQETHAVAYPDPRSMQYGGYWSSSK